MTSSPLISAAPKPARFYRQNAPAAGLRQSRWPGYSGKERAPGYPAESNYSGDGEPIKNCINANTIASALVKNAFGASAG
jgi:hypothetical protein